MSLNGKITLTRTSGPDSDRISLSLVDDESSATILEARMDLETLALVLTGQARLPIKYQIYNAHLAGMTRENSSVKVFIPDGTTPADTDLITDKAVLRQLGEGWKVNNYRDANNHHRCSGWETVDGVKGRWQTIGTYRHLDAAE